MLYHVDKPYPKPQVEKKNLKYADILSFSYAGAISEQTAIHQYLYQSFCFNDEFSEILEKISIVEMHHFKLLAQTIHLLGLEPNYQSATTDYRFIPWTSENVPYPPDKKEMLKIDIHSETLAIQTYQAAISQIDDPYIQQLLKRIIEDEELHIQIFQTLLDKEKDVS